MAEEEIGKIIINLIQKEKPEDTKKLILLIQERYSFSSLEIERALIGLENKNINFIPAKKSEHKRLTQLSFLRTNLWYWSIIIISISAAISSLTITEDSYPLFYFRSIFGLIFISFLPGYSFLKVVFLTDFKKNKKNDIKVLENVILGIGLSLVLVSIVGLILNFTPFGIRLTPIVLSLFALTFIFSTVALYFQKRANTKTSSFYWKKNIF
jgi:uncharacterized membrane protein